MPSQIDPFIDWFLRIQASTDYLGLESMQAGVAYAIWARNAYVGIWLPEAQGFVISRYKMSPTPFLSVEYHWDTGEPYGTAKPLRPLQSCPLPLPPKSAYDNNEQNAPVCAWLDALEAHHPPLPGWDSVGNRRRAALSWVQRQERQRARIKPQPGQRMG